MITHVYSDPHFGHENIIKYEQRPFDDVRQHDAALIELYNAEVHPEDTVLWLDGGDSGLAGRVNRGSNRRSLDDLYLHRLE